MLVGRPAVGEIGHRIGVSAKPQVLDPVDSGADQLVADEPRKVEMFPPAVRSGDADRGVWVLLDEGGRELRPDLVVWA